MVLCAMLNAEPPRIQVAAAAAITLTNADSGSGMMTSALGID
jgi:hypothetical protein